MRRFHLIFDRCAKIGVTNHDLLLQALPLLFQLLLPLFELIQVHEGVDDDREDQVHDEEVAEDQVYQRVYDGERWMVDIDHVVHEGAPVICRYHLVDKDERVKDIIEVRDAIEDLAIGCHVLGLDVYQSREVVRVPTEGRCSEAVWESDIWTFVPSKTVHGAGADLTSIFRCNMWPNPTISAVIEDWLWCVSATVEKLGAVLVQPQYGHQDKDEDQKYSNI